MAKDNFCIYCGFKLFPEDHFCPNCGAKLDDDKEKPNKSSKYESSKSYDYQFYKNQIDNLKETYETKEKKVLELLEKKFPQGQMSYYRFREEVDICRVNFYKEAETALNMINLSDEYSDKVIKEIKNKIKTLESIVNKINELQSELIIRLSNSDEDSDNEIDDLINEMNELIDSLKDYE